METMLARGSADRSSLMDVTREVLAIASVRQATAQRHTELEALLQLSPSLDFGRYLHALRGFELFLSEWEPRIELALPPALRDWFASRSRRGLLQRDLDKLDKGRVTRDEVEQSCAQAVSEIELCSVAATFGSLYVMEGSTLGGQVIARIARATLGLDAGNGAAYFAGNHSHTAASWTSFKSLFEDQVGIESTSRLEACAAAQQTFDALITTFTRLSHAGTTD